MELSKHGIEGLNNGGEIWSGKGQISREDMLNAYYAEVGQITNIMTKIVENFYGAYKTASSDVLAGYEVSYNVMLAKYRKVSKDFYKAYLDYDWNEKEDANYIEWASAGIKMREDIQNSDIKKEHII